MFKSVVEVLEKEAQEQPWGPPHLPLALEDRPFHQAGNAQSFIRHSVIFGDGEAISIGATCHRYPGIQYLAIFFPVGSGNADEWDLAGRMAAYYTARHIDNVIFEVASPIKLPQDSQGLLQIQVRCPFYFDIRS